MCRCICYTMVYGVRCCVWRRELYMPKTYDTSLLPFVAMGCYLVWEWWNGIYNGDSATTKLGCKNSMGWNKILLMVLSIVVVEEGEIWGQTCICECICKYRSRRICNITYMGWDTRCFEDQMQTLDCKMARVIDSGLENLNAQSLKQSVCEIGNIFIIENKSTIFSEAII